MDDEHLLTVGRFARLCGLSAYALRHYDDVGLLAPARVDPGTGYRYYGRDQVGIARLIAALRCTDLPLEDTRAVLRDPAGDAARTVLSRHRRRLVARSHRLDQQVRDLDRFRDQGVTVPATLTTCRPCQVKLAVEDEAATAAFYERVFGARYEVTRRDGDDEYRGLVFGTYGEPDFFLVHLLAREDDEFDRPGSSTIGLLVPDLDEVHARALAAGGTELVAAQDPGGMPRCSAVRDPSGNAVWLYQG